jgi:hypothetical protein
MKNIVLSVFVICISIVSLNAQNAYRQNFLSAFNKQPQIKSCEEAYNFNCCIKGVCDVFNKTNESLKKANEELSELQLAANNSMSNSNTPVNAEEGKDLADKLDKMSKEEKMKWAMQNAANYMPSAKAHANKDMNNRKVNDAVKYIMKNQGAEMDNINSLANCGKKLDEIEKKYKDQREKVLNKFQSVTNSSYDPSSSSPYIYGEASDQQVAKMNKAIEEYKKEIIPIWNNELKEKLNFILKEEKDYTAKYTIIEEKIAATNYSDDAQEQVNKMHLIRAHHGVLQQVISYIESLKSVISDYANQYAALMKKPAIN